MASIGFLMWTAAACLVLPARGQETGSREERWGQDLDFFAEAIKRTHPDPFTKLSRTDFDQSIEQVKHQASQLQDYQILGAINKITARMGDSHTSMNPFATGQVHSFPLQFWWFSDGFYAVAGGGVAAPVLGKKLVSIDGRSAAEVFDRIKTMFPFENQYWPLIRGAEYLSGAEILHNAGISQERSSAVFEFEGNLKITLGSTSVESFLFPRKARPRPPLYQQHQNLYYWFEYLADAKVLYIKYNVCAEDPTLPASDFGRQIVEFMKGKPLDKAVIDLRSNSGGDSRVLARWIEPLEEAFRAGTLILNGGAYAILSRQTFSSGMLAAIDLKQLGTVLVGEPSGGIPNGFGDVHTFNLPNAGWRFQVSTKTFRFPAYDDADTVRPDILVDFAIQDYADQTDPYLEAILKQ